MTGQRGKQPEILTPGEVARLFRVSPPVVLRWVQEGRVTSIKTPGGARRFPSAQFDHVFRYLRGES
jgi:excisionase family DNA binding protein